MGLKFTRQKKRHLLLSIIYRLHRLFKVSNKFKFKTYLDLAWIFHRLAHETSFKIYDELNHPIRLNHQDFLFNRISKNDFVLDLGCKYGYITNNLANHAKKVVGIDYDNNAILKAKNTHQKPNLEFVNAEAIQYLKNSTNSFDILVLSHVLEHIDNPLEFLKSFAHFFKYIYIELPDFEATLLNVYRVDAGTSLTYLDADHIHEFDRKEMKELIQNAGLTLLESEYIYGVQKYWCENKKQP